MTDVICYCFHFTVDDIQQDYTAKGYSTILEKIKREKQSGNCQCAVQNPKGR